MKQEGMYIYLVNLHRGIKAITWKVHNYYCKMPNWLQTLVLTETFRREHSVQNDNVPLQLTEKKQA